MKYKINISDAIPNFEGKDQEGFGISTEDLLGTPVVLYFYPKDDTPGCTKEACSFRDNMERLTGYDVSVIGVSPDSSESHQKFIKKHDLNFTLIADPKQEICKKFDVIQEKMIYGEKKMGVERTTFLLDRDGLVVWLERPVTVEGHVDRVIDAIKKFL